jgi:hypothetical protein
VLNLLLAWSPGAAAQLPPRDTPPAHVGAARRRRRCVPRSMPKAGPSSRGLALARFQEQRKAADEAEQTLLILRKEFPDERVWFRR